MADDYGSTVHSVYLLFNGHKTMKLAALFTGGKDSTYAIYLAKQQGNEITCLITLNSQNLDSYMFHTPAIELTELQAEAMNLPIIVQITPGKKEKELTDLKKAIKLGIKKYKIQGVVTGAVESIYQASRIQKICDNLKIECFNPLWQKDQTELMEELLKNDFKFILTSVAAEGLSKKWLGKIISLKKFDELKKLNQKIGISICGEGGEFETLVLDSPLFNKKIKLIKTKIEMDSKHSGRLIIEKAE